MSAACRLMNPARKFANKFLFLGVGFWHKLTHHLEYSEPMLEYQCILATPSDPDSS